MKNQFVPLMVMLLVLSGCVKMPNVKLYADAIVDTKAEASLIATDFSASCERRMKYQYRMDIPVKEGDKRYPLYLLDVDACKEWNKYAEMYSKSHQTLLYYGVALQTLTADDQIDFSQQLEGLKKNVDSLMKEMGETSIDVRYGKGMGDATLAASTAIMKWATDFYRRKQIAIVFSAYGLKMNNFIVKLRDFVAFNYGELLKIEEKRADIYFDAMLHKSNKEEQMAKIPTFTNSKEKQKKIEAYFKEQKDLITSYSGRFETTIKDQRMEYHASLDERKAILKSYTEKLDSILIAHEKLVEMAGKGQLDVETLFKEVQPLIKDIYSVRGKFEAVEWK